ncbi:MAG: isoleucine--tRNA ligase [Rhodovarius sp.]|nr:isoleucine--tRNA ligase [Rhodovarius sp.]MCX7931922.1 isoleucine--tRNA ligase [Rhodovarius sp.]MDW8314449.1 isoleucine--tRNA ligase [Rhodovarius sp.]
MNDAPPRRDYRHTVFLPTTSFPMRGELPRREPELLARWQRIGLYRRLREASRGRPPFVLHDGPPYANGPLHIGHALNKILKDVINRAAQMSGRDADFIPGWDCHGLPIEWKVEEEYRARRQDKDAVPVLEFRAECRAYAQKWLEHQREEFKRLGVIGDWERPYTTMAPRSEALIMAEIGRFLMNGSLYRGLRPVMWSPVEKTALAEAEIEYHDHRSAILYALFPLLRAPAAHDLVGAHAVIWTTTPWTLPANRALAYGEEIEYALLHVEGVAEGSCLRPGLRLIVALRLLPDVAAACGIGAHTLIRVFPGRELAGAVAASALRGHAGAYGHEVPLLPGDFVTEEAGTGIVHIAPSHGEDDFQLGRAHGLPVPETVAADGTYTAEAPGFVGLHVFRAHEAVWAALAALGTLAGKGFITHSYPHSWRSKQPVIFRATPQWFIAMDDANAIRQKALAAIAATRFIPEAGRNRLAGMVAARPDWCISRQRAWGVPIAVFVDRRTGEPLRDQAVVDRIVAAFMEEGADAWYKPDAASRFLGPGRDPADYEQVMDIVDVWFESGSTHAFVLPERNLPFPADLYLEGSDQHRGWFHSSLLESVGTRGIAPFKAVLTHGFVLDEQGRKMSKSLGNVTAPQEVLKEYGADILRLWVMNSDTAQDLRIGPGILKQQAELYRRIRNTLRWILGGLAGYSEAEEALPYSALPELERWVLHRLSELDRLIRAAVDSHDWTGVIPELHGFCNNDLSAFYFDIRKDSLYCDAPASPRRRAVRTVLDQLHRCLTAWFAPVLVFTAEEAWLARFPGDEESVHLRQFPDLPAAWRDDALAARWERIRAIRREVTATLEQARAQGEIGAFLQAAPILELPPEDAALLPAEAWAELCITSAATIRPADRLAIRFAKAPGAKCERCWRVLPEVGSSPDHPTLCRRCEAVVTG